MIDFNKKLNPHSIEAEQAESEDYKAVIEAQALGLHTRR